MLNATPHTTAEQRLRIVRATEKEDEWGNGDDESGEGGVSGKTVSRFAASVFFYFLRFDVGFVWGWKFVALHFRGA